MAANYVLIREVTLNQSISSITLDNLPSSGYTDLKIKLSYRSDRAGSNNGPIQFRFNGDTASNYSERFFYGSGSTVGGSQTASATYISMIGGAGDSAGNTANTFNSQEVYIPGYRTSNQKCVSSNFVSEGNTTAGYMMAGAGTWNQTSAITSITIFDQGANFVAGSSFSLYGIAAVGTTPTVVPKASGGDIVVNDGTYWIHTFYSSGIFRPNTNLSCDYLVVAGGAGGGGTGRSGAGGYQGVGGGGAGGFRTASAYTFATDTNHVVTVGAGGAGGNGYLENGYAGSDSILGAITSVGGGYGAASSTGNTGGTGGSGGGGASNLSGGSATSGQGYAGGSGSGSSGGGGGGAGAAGAAGATNGGDGGVGVSSSINGTATYYAGGGGGGTETGTPGAGGNGGGGAGGIKSQGGVSNNVQSGNAGTAYTGGGGGGASGTDGVQGTRIGGNGGSGIVIVRYLMA